MKTSLERLRRWLSRRPSRSRRLSLLGGALASALLFAFYSRAESPLFVLGFVALVPWLFALDRAASTREAAAAGALQSAAFVAAVFPWFPEAAHRYSQASPILLWLVMLVAAPLLEPQFVTLAVVRHLVKRAPGRFPVLQAAMAGACVYVGTELFVPKLFFDTLGLGLHPSAALRQVADIAGVHGLSLVLVLVNEGIAASLHRYAGARAARATETTLERATARKRIAVPLAASIALLLGCFGYGFFRYAEVAARDGEGGHVVGIVQANITNYDKLRAEKGAFETVRTILDTHYALSDEIRAQKEVDLLLWPETVYPTTYGAPKSEAGAAFDAEIAAFAQKRGVPLVFGAYDTEAGREFNAAFFLTTDSARPAASVYRKRMLFPLTEWVPASIDGPWLREALPWTGHWQRGPGPQIVPITLRGGERVSVVPLICYDVLFPAFVAEAAAMGADFIVTLSNDSWFPDERAPRLHLVSAAFRSIETRLSQVRATNSGISAMIMPTGEIIAETRWAARQTLITRLPKSGRMTPPAMTLGPYLGPVTLAAALLFALSAIVRHRGAPKDEAQEPPQRRRKKRKYAGTRPK
jgi:apolipoprotein N-acyltransferase